MTPTTIRIEDKTKNKAKKLAEAIGCSFNDLINMLLKKAIRDDGIDLRNIRLTENGFTPEFEQSVLDAEKEGVSMEFDSIDKMVTYAKNED